VKAACLLALGLAVAAAPALAQRSVPRDEFFDMRWVVEREAGRDVAVVGSLGNHYLYPLTEVLLQVQVLDRTGGLVQEALGPVGSTVPAGSRVTFRVPLPAEGARYTVLVYRFQFAPGENP
jgi:hypothetical protein